MRLSDFNRYLLACLVLSGALFAWRGWDNNDPQPNESAVNAEHSSAQRPMQQIPVASSSSDSSLPARSQVRQRPSRLPLQPQDFPADDHPKGWDELGSAERMEHLEERFSTALAALEAGEQPVAKHAFVAESALTSMRAELYGSAAGRARHQRQEIRLDNALGEAEPVEPGNKGAPK